MKFIASSTPALVAAVATLSLFLIGAAGPLMTQASGGDHEQHKDHEKHGMEPGSEASLAAQLAELRASVVRLESALEVNHEGLSQGADKDSMQAGSMKAGGMKMGMGKMGKMGGMNKGMGKMGMGPMGMGKMSMGSMGAMPSSSMQISALPGFPGASHLYHIGATSFFLDHSDHIVLTTEQVTQLNQARESAQLQQATNQRKIEQAEQELWVLTGSDAPDAAKIDAKVREIEKLRGDGRIAFIRAIGEGARILTEEQRMQLSGMAAPASSMPSMSGMGSDM